MGVFHNYFDGMFAVYNALRMQTFLMSVIYFIYVLSNIRVSIYLQYMVSQNAPNKMQRFVLGFCLQLTIRSI